MFRFLFYRLLLAHMLGEFPLQTTKISEFKQRKFVGIIFHSVIYTLIILIFSLPCIAKFWPFIIIIGVTHILIEQARVSVIRYLKKDNLWIFLIKQILHIVVIYSTLLTGNVKNYSPLEPYSLPETITLSFESFGRLFLYTYYDDKTIIYYAGFCFSIFVTSFIIYYLEKLILPKEEQLLIGSYRELIGFIERGMITAFAIKGWILYIIIYTVIRFIICVILKLYINQELPWRLLIWDTILNITLAGIYGFIINYWIKIISPA